MHRHHPHEYSAGSNIQAAFWLNLGFTIIEIAGGLLTNSMAVLADALHDLGDSFSLGLSWYFEKLSGRKPTSTFSYGFKRFSLLAALTNGFVILFGSFLILSKTIPRLIHPEHSNAQGMFVFALLGILVNGLAAWRLKSGKTMNERMVGWRMIEDVLGWLAVLIVSIVMIFKDIQILDPILSILITLYILWNVVKNFKKTFMLFLQGVPEDLNIENFEKTILNIKNIRGLHDTHIWSLDGEHNILTTHVVIDKNLPGEEVVKIKCHIKELLARVNIEHATLEMEYEGERCHVEH